MVETDRQWMERALFLAARGQGRTTPNPMVGAVVVSREGLMVGQGWHERAGAAHAEVVALDEARGRAEGATLYVSLEPCCHIGRTGPCTERILAAGIARVVAAATDPDPRVRGRGIATLRGQGIDVDVGLCGEAAARLNHGFNTVKTERRPMVVLKVATSLDARVTARRGERCQISSRAAHRRAHVLRATVDAIAVGSETMCIDDPLLTARECHRIRPLVRVIFDRRLRTSPRARVFSTLAEGPVLVVTAPGSRPDSQPADSPQAQALSAAGAVILPAATLADAAHALLQWDVSTVLVEGGPVLHAAFIEARLVDRLHVIVSPHCLGEDGVPWVGIDQLATEMLTFRTAQTCGADTWIEADVHRHH